MKRLESRKSHSWWWDSHIGPKNSKWLADNLDEMDKNVKHMVKLIEEDGDSFAKRAEMYYKKRPELMAHVEEFYRMYRALAERYDHVTGELQKNVPSPDKMEVTKAAKFHELEEEEEEEEEDEKAGGSSLLVSTSIPKKVGAEVEISEDVLSEVTKSDVEAVIKKQDTHDLYCPNCRSCITKTVVLSRRKPSSFVRLSEHDKQESTDVEFMLSSSPSIPSGIGFKRFRDTQTVQDPYADDENTSSSVDRTITSSVEKDKMEVKPQPHKQSPDCPNLTSLSLQTNSDLTSIPASFFELMPNLKDVDLSDTSIKSLPRSFFDLVSLQKLFLRNCQVFMELPAEIGQLHNLEVLDLEGTDIIQLPAEIGDLVKLTCLKVSFCQWSCDLGETTMFPEGALSKLAQLVELCIDVDPEDSRWEGAVQVVIKELVHLKKLKYLKMYVPQVEILGELTRNLPFLLGSSTTGYDLNVGSHMRRVMSPTPLGAEGKSEHTKKQLRYVNGNGSIPSQVKNLLKYSDALFLDRHFTVSTLSEFGMHNLENLRYCMLGECNELKTIVQGNDDDDDDDDDDDEEYKYPVLPELQELIIYDMKTLTSIYNARSRHDSLRRLKVLKLHGCVQLRTIFVFEAGIGLVHLEEITVQDCPAVLSLVTCSSPGQIRPSFPRLKKISLHYLTELQSIFSGLCTAPCLERLSVYDCPNLKTLSAMDISRVDDLKVIRGEEEWWEALEWNESEWEEGCLQKLVSVFVPIRSDADLETQLAQDPIPESGKERALARQHFSSMASSLVQSNKAMKSSESRKSHSWWWDSHIGAKNSRWLADNLEEMDKSVKHMLKLIEEDGDSFAKKAEMYYKKRPELIAHVEKSYRMYRALAERYDHVTGELQKNVPSDLQYQPSDVLQTQKKMVG